MTALAVSLDDVRAAFRATRTHLRLTPLLESPLLNEKLCFRLLVKAESLQMTGSFKARGALNQMMRLSARDKKHGIMAMSSGNHGQAIAWAARMLGVPASILMPHDAPPFKVAAVRAWGAEIMTYNRDTEDREAVGHAHAARLGRRMIHSYDDVLTIAGQGTVGLELIGQARALRASPDAIIVNCCGGGLASGIAVTRDLYETPPALYTAEPFGFNDAQRTFADGAIAVNERKSGSICDALLMPHLGKLTLPILQHHQAQGLSVTDEMVLAAMTIAADHFKLTLEPSGAVSLACAIAEYARFRDKTVIAVVTGSNVGADAYAGFLQAGLSHRHRLLDCAFA